MRKSNKIKLLYMISLVILISSFSFGSVDNGLNLIGNYTYPLGNLIKNGHFENNYTYSDFEGWTEGQFPDPAAFKPISSPTIPPKSGRKMIGVNFSVPSSLARFLVSDLYKLKPNSWYTFFIYYQTENYEPSTEPINPTFQTFRDRDFENESVSEVDLPTAGQRNGAPYNETTDWTLYVHRFKTGGEVNYGNVSLLFGGTAGNGGDFYFEDAHLVEGCVKTNITNDELPDGCSNEDKATEYDRDNRHPNFVEKSWKYANSKNKVIQTVTENGNLDIVRANFYDEFGRIHKSTLPLGDNFDQFRHKFVPDITGLGNAQDRLNCFYRGERKDNSPCQNDVLLDESPIDNSKIFYQDANEVGYFEFKYENSNLGREIEKSQPGNDWKMGGGHTIRTEFHSATSVEINPNTNLPVKGANPNLFVKKIIDQDGNESIEVKDRFGNTVRQSNKLVKNNGVNWIHTDFIYDSNGRLIKILNPPGYQNNVQYVNTKFNSKNHLVEEETPATGKTKYFYDRNDNSRFKITAKQKNVNEFSYTMYDRLDRVIESGDAKYNGTDIENILSASVNNGIFPYGSSNVKIYPKVKNHYDNQLFLKSSDCLPPPDISEAMFFVPEIQGVMSANFYQSLNIAYDDIIRNLTEKGSFNGNILIYALFTPNATNKNVRLDLDSKIILNYENNTNTVNVKFTIKALNSNDPLALQFSQNTLLKVPFVLGKYLEGKLVKTVSCNYEFAGEYEIGQISKYFDYDKNGNIVSTYQQNTFIHDPNKMWQLSKNLYDKSYRIVQKLNCAGLDCTNSTLIHEENYEYDQLGKIKRIIDKSGNILLDFYYDNIGRLSFQGVGNEIDQNINDESLVKKNSYHLHGMLTSQILSKLKSPETNVFEEVITYENGGNQNKFDGSVTSTKYKYSTEIPSVNNLKSYFNYDSFNRLKQVITEPIVQNRNTLYEYYDDGSLKIVSRGIRNGTYLYNNKNQLSSIEGNLIEGRAMHSEYYSTIFDYDENGNLIFDYSKGFVENQAPKEIFPLTISYNSNDLPYKFEYKAKTSGDMFTIYMAYDEGGNRVSKTTFKNDVFDEIKSYFIFGKEIRESNITKEFNMIDDFGRVEYNGDFGFSAYQYFLKDYLGSTKGVYEINSTSYAGTVTWAYDYFPFGKEIEIKVGQDNESITEQFTGKEFDKGIGLNYFGARYYDADLGLWTSPDALRQFSNLYSYAGNGTNPVNGADPDGNCFTGFFTIPCIAMLVLLSAKDHTKPSGYATTPLTEFGPTKPLKLVIDVVEKGPVNTALDETVGRVLKKIPGSPKEFGLAAEATDKFLFDPVKKHVKNQIVGKIEAVLDGPHTSIKAPTIPLNPADDTFVREKPIRPLNKILNN